MAATRRRTVPRAGLTGLIAFAARRPVATLLVVIILALGGGLLALGLQPSTGSDTFVSRSSADFQVTTDDQAHFGGDPVIVLIKEPLSDLVLTRELATVTKLEACLAGQTVQANANVRAFTPAPAGSAPPYGGWSSPCGALMRAHAVQVVYGPGTFLNRAVSAVNQEVSTVLAGARSAEVKAARSAYSLAIGRGESKKQAVRAGNAAYTLEQQNQNDQLTAMALQSGITSLPSIDSQSFISQIVFDQTRGVDQPKARFAYLFPTARSALIQIRLRASLSSHEQARVISLIRQAVKMPMFASAYGGTYTVSGAPVVVEDLAAALTHSIAVLLLAAVAVMAIALLAFFHSPLRLLPLVIALASVGITFGLMALVGSPLTMASIAVLPILIGLAVDYAVQFQSRVAEVRAGSEDRNSADAAADARAAVGKAASAGVPTLGVAALATATGFLVLLLSPVPMVRSFAVLLVVGIGVALVCALTAGTAAIILAARGLDTRLRAALRGAGEIARAPARLVRRRRRARVPSADAATRPIALLDRALHSPGRILALGAVLAVLGWVADTQTRVQSDVTKLVPDNMPALRDLRDLERVTGVSGEIDIVVHAHDVATPQTIGWMIDYERKLFAHYGYLETTGCAASTLCPALSLPDLFSAGSQSPRNVAAGLTSASIQSLLNAVPNYFRRAVITSDQHEATLAFGIRLMPLSRQAQVISYMRSALHPPPGVSAGLAGLPVLAAQANASLSSSPRRLLTLLAGLVLVGIVLMLVLRSVERVIVPLVPIMLATGWSALILFAIGIPLNPMSATLGALVIAISTEFSVLLSERYRAERRAGRDAPAALAATYRLTGAAVLASGLTAIAGFGVLVVSDITMLRDFGFVTVIDLTVSLAGVLVVLPAVLAVSEREDLREQGLAGWRSVAAMLPRPRRRTRVA